MKTLYDTIPVRTEENLIKAPSFRGEIASIMPELKKKGLKSISVEEVLKQRIIAWQSENQRLISPWESNHFDTSDTLIYYPNGGIEINLNSQSLKKVNERSSLIKTSGTRLELELSEEKLIPILNNVMFSKIDVDYFTDRNLNKKEVLENPIWLALVNNNYDLLEEYTNQVFSKFENPDGLMNIYIGSRDENISGRIIERNWCVLKLAHNQNLGIVGNIRIKDSNGYVVGLKNKII